MALHQRRERERAELRRLIMDAARRLFAAEGYAAVSMRRIADVIDYSATAIYFHFKDKQSLIRELVADDFNQLAVAFADLAGVADPVDRLRRLGRLYVGFAVEHPNHYKLMFMTEVPATEPPPDAGKPEAHAYNFLLHTVEQGIAAGRYRPGLTDPQLAAQTVWAAVHGVASLQIAMGADPCIRWAPLEDRTAAAVDGILDGLLASPTTVSAAPARKHR
jgi:AcrR family transcriptional regulator